DGASEQSKERQPAPGSCGGSPRQLYLGADPDDRRRIVGWQTSLPRPLAAENEDTRRAAQRHQPAPGPQRGAGATRERQEGGEQNARRPLVRDWRFGHAAPSGGSQSGQSAMWSSHSPGFTLASLIVRPRTETPTA